MIKKTGNEPENNKFKRFLKYRILHIDDSPRQIALGVAIGLFVAWTPALGMHTLMAIGLCILLRANKFAGIAFVWTSNLFTFIPIYYPNYLVGRYILRSFSSNPDIPRKELGDILEQLNYSTGFNAIFDQHFWINLFKSLWEMGYELWIGSIIMGILVALLGYLIIYQMVVQQRKTALNNVN